ncbi:S9 family peptidase [Saccharopolyspora gregorii]|uniref:S9 family peptidase n=1 Tax=Saccharopolyspora gregorii TaxID=33914 RepID=A0ABP6RHU4_9PSEU
MALPDILPVEAFFDSPERAGASISPDGTRIAYLAPWKNRLNVWVRGVEDDSEARCVTADETRSVTGYHWTDDPRWLLYVQDAGGNEDWHLFRVDLDDPDAPAVDLTPYPPGVRTSIGQQRPDRPGKVLVQLNARELDRFDLVEIDISSGESTVLAENPGTVLDWLPGAEIYARSITEDGALELSRHDPATGELTPITTFTGDGHPIGINPFELDADGTGVWLGSYRDGDRALLARFDLTTGEESEVDSHPELDLDGDRRIAVQQSSPLIRDRASGRLLGVRYLGERQEIRALDDEFAEVLAKLDALSDGDLAGISRDDTGRRWVVSFTHDRDPGATWFYDHATGESRLLFRSYPHLDPESLAPMTPVTIPARDGLPLPSYLTLPVGVEPRGLPLVLLVHGGPWYRDSWGYSPEVQLLANRGYAVLQVNFRGSTGYGKRHLEAAIGELAGAMHDDLIDAADWAVEQGYADPERLAISGGSYGGYAALVGVTFTPDKFAAAVDYVGISDLVNFTRTLPPFARRGLIGNWYRYAGDPDVPEQRVDMLARSPITRVDRIRTPLLVAQGANDARVVQAESDNIVAALRARGVEVEYLVKEDEGHGFLNPENQIELHRAIERFFAAHLGGRSEAA